VVTAFGRRLPLAGRRLTLTARDDLADLAADTPIDLASLRR
jgi:hypothetical protein